MRRYYWVVRNFFSRVAYWRQGYTWHEAGIKVCFVHIRKAIADMEASHREYRDIAVFRSNRHV